MNDQERMAMAWKIANETPSVKGGDYKDQAEAMYYAIEEEMGEDTPDSIPHGGDCPRSFWRWFEEASS